jgi:hypothetical protein
VDLVAEARAFELLEQRSEAASGPGAAEHLAQETAESAAGRRLLARSLGTTAARDHGQDHRHQRGRDPSEV